MAIAGQRSIKLTFTGGVNYTQTFDAQNNAASNAEQLQTDLAPGFNAFIIPTAGTTLPIAVTIIPSTTNTLGMTLKGVTGDTGIPLNPADPTSLAVSTTATTFGITAASTIKGVRIIYT